MGSLNLNFFSITIPLLSPEKCKKIIDMCEQKGFDKIKGYDPNYRNNTRYAFINK